MKCEVPARFGNCPEAKFTATDIRVRSGNSPHTVVNKPLPTAFSFPEPRQLADHSTSRVFAGTKLMTHGERGSDFQLLNPAARSMLAFGFLHLLGGPVHWRGFGVSGRGYVCRGASFRIDRNLAETRRQKAEAGCVGEENVKNDG